VKRYYAQLHSLENRFPLQSEHDLVEFSWRDVYSSYVFKTGSVKYEMASILYNIAALYTQLAAEESREDSDSMKLACTYFQCASWAFGELKSKYSGDLRGDLSSELMIFKQNMCLAQAQECILEKSLADNRKAQIVAKVTAQVISFYNSAMSALFGQNEDGLIQDFIGSKIYKEWTKYIKFKISYLSAILFLYQGMHSEEQRKMGERVALFNAACEKLEEAKKESKGMNKIDVINEALTLTTDIIEGKRKNAKQENEFIYHESIPEISSVSAVQGACLVQGIPFDVTDAKVIGEDIFKRLVPMKAHEHLSVYSEEKANLLRSLGARIDDRDAELASFMGSLNHDMLKAMEQTYFSIPQSVADRCVELSGKPNAIPDLVDSMSSLAEICYDVESSLKEVKSILDEEARRETEVQKQIGKRPSGHMTELTREYSKYMEAHSKAGESNDTLRKAMELHVTNLKILAQPLPTLQAQVPQISPIDQVTRKELQTLLNKVEEMKVQRDGLYNDLREEILNKDDITAQLLANGDKEVEELFKKELAKYSRSIKTIELNLEAQGNILKALTDTYAKHAMTLKAFNDNKLKADQFYSSLVASFDIYEDLIAKSVKGLDFYKKLHTNVMKLLSRVKAARDVQEEERQQLMRSMAPKAPPPVVKPIEKSYTNTISTAPPQSMTATSGMKLKDYLKSGMVPGMGLRDDVNKLPAIRPSPVGQETISSTNPVSCQINTNQYPLSGYQNYQQPSLDQQSNGSGSMTSSTTSLNNSDYHSQFPINPTSNQGYVNPIYQNQQVDYNAINQFSYPNYPNVNNTQNLYKIPSQSPAPTSLPTEIKPPTANYGQQQSYQNPSYYQQQQPPQQYPVTPSPTPSYPVAQSPALSQTGGQMSQYSNQQQQSVASTPYGGNQTTSVTSTTTYGQQQYQSTQNQSGQQQYQSTLNQSGQQQFQPTQNQPYGNYQQNFPQQTLQNQTGFEYQSGVAFNQNSTLQQPQQLQYPSNYQNPNQILPQQVKPQEQTNYQNPTFNQNPPQLQDSSQYQTNYQNQPQTQVASQYPTPTPTQQGYQNYNNYYGQTNQQQQYPGYQYNNTTYPSTQQQQPDQPIQSNLNNIQQQVQQPQSQVASTQAPQQPQTVVAPVQKPVPKSSNIDLLADIDFSINSIPTLTPLKAENSPVKVLQPITPVEIEKPPVAKLNEDLTDIDLSISKINISETNVTTQIEQEKSKKLEDPFDDANILKQFHKEVESLEKFMETLTIKTLSGVTPLVNKWKELQDLLVKDESKRLVSVAKLFPEKNRNVDCLPYDHARISLPTTTDNYINAAIVRDCGPISFIITQTPLSNTVNDYWEMVLSQNSNFLVCLHSIDEVSIL
jgi:tyrosine-protein phosphatase non-receptor type 23